MLVAQGLPHGGDIRAAAVAGNLAALVDVLAGLRVAEVDFDSGSVESFPIRLDEGLDFTVALGLV